MGSAGYSADIDPAPEGSSGELSWTLHWPDQGRWLGYNVEVTVEARKSE
jgi:hypothetical protein